MEKEANRDELYACVSVPEMFFWIRLACAYSVIELCISLCFRVNVCVSPLSYPPPDFVFGEVNHACRIFSGETRKMLFYKSTFCLPFISFIVLTSFRLCSVTSTIPFNFLETHLIHLNGTKRLFKCVKIFTRGEGKKWRAKFRMSHKLSF